MVALAHEKMGRVDILVNNAGIRARKAFGEFSHEDFDRLVAVNLRTPFFASQAVIPIMRAQGGGHIVHMASQLGIVAARYGAIYSLTKAGLIQLTRSMALELAGDGISVNAVCPGPISTEGFLAGRNPGELEQRARDVPIGRFGTVEEVAAMVALDQATELLAIIPPAQGATPELVSTLRVVEKLLENPPPAGEHLLAPARRKAERNLRQIAKQMKKWEVQLNRSATRP